MRKILSAVLVGCAMVGAAGCAQAEGGSGDAAVQSTTPAVETGVDVPGASTANPGELLPLEQRAAKAGVSVEVAKTWEKNGVHITNSGAVYGEDCGAARSVRMPIGKNIIC